MQSTLGPLRLGRKSNKNNNNLDLHPFQVADPLGRISLISQLFGRCFAGRMYRPLGRGYGPTGRSFHSAAVAFWALFTQL